jgi:hypothetical protein
MRRTATIGFDRKLRQEWLDVIAAKQSAGLTVRELRRLGHQFLRGDCPADEARGKTLTVLFHLWVDVPAKAASLRDAAGELFVDVEPHQRIALHWGLGLATYPFFRDVADTTGRLLALQGDVSLAQIQRRLAERWGEKSTTKRATQRIVRTWIDWRVLRENKQKGLYFGNQPIVISGSLACWVIEAVLVGSESGSQIITHARKAPSLFPFETKIAVHELRQAPRLTVHRQGWGEDVVVLDDRKSHLGTASRRGQLRLL